MRETRCVLVLIFVFFALPGLLADDGTADILWPMPDNDTVSSTFGEYRPRSNYSDPHFHMGIDISGIPGDIVLGTVIVYKVVKWDYLSSSVKTDPDGWVKIVHCTRDSMLLNEGSKYIHLRDIFVKEDSFYDISAWDTLPKIGTINDKNHLHFEFWLNVEGSDSVAVNPFSFCSVYTNSVVGDYISPILLYVFLDVGEDTGYVESFSYSWGDFSQYYSVVDSGGVSFVRLTLPKETPENNFDDPHFIVRNAGEVEEFRFILQGYDEWGGQLCGIYRLVAKLDGDTVYDLVFDSIGVGEKYQEEDVYHVEPPVVSSLGIHKYFRLYRYDPSGGGIPGCVLTVKGMNLDSLEEGLHHLWVEAWDCFKNRKTGDVWFYVTSSSLDSLGWLNSYEELLDSSEYYGEEALFVGRRR